MVSQETKIGNSEMVLSEMGALRYYHQSLWYNHSAQARPEDMFVWSVFKELF